MSDTKRETIQAQAERFAGTRVAVCRCKHCKVAFLAEKRSSKWCSAGCRKAAFINRQARPAKKDKRAASVIEEVFVSAFGENQTAKPVACCVHCRGKVRNRIEEAICGMCGLNFDGA